MQPEAGKPGGHGGAGWKRVARGGWLFKNENPLNLIWSPLNENVDSDIPRVAFGDESNSEC